MNNKLLFLVILVLIIILSIFLLSGSEDLSRDWVLIHSDSNKSHDIINID